MAAATTLIAACGSATPTGVATAPPGGGITDTPGATASPTPNSTPTPSATTAPTSTAVTASPGGSLVPNTDENGANDVAALLYPQGPNASACGVGRAGGYSSCPASDRLVARLQSNPVPHAEPLCRCQQTWSQRQITVTPQGTGGVAHVVLLFCGSNGCQPGGYSTSIRIDVAVLRTQERGWVADDTLCTSQGPSTSIYANNPPPCSS